jgi:hypothetical protein
LALPGTYNRNETPRVPKADRGDFRGLGTVNPWCGKKSKRHRKKTRTQNKKNKKQENIVNKLKIIKDLYYITILSYY